MGSKALDTGKEYGKIILGIALSSLIFLAIVIALRHGGYWDDFAMGFILVFVYHSVRCYIDH